MTAAHEAVFIEDDVAGFASEDGAVFGQAIDVLGNVSHADLNEFIVSSARRGAHVSGAVGGTRFV